MESLALSTVVRFPLATTFLGFTPLLITPKREVSS